jgi:hypothetical protein
MSYFYYRIFIIFLIFPIAISSQELTPLPFRLLTFEGERAGYMKSHLFWTTFSEYKSDYFEIQRETGNEPFKTIGIIDANGYTERITKYSFIDANPSSGYNYYRLKQMDQDNSYV